jgi:hypothetical protein
MIVEWVRDSVSLTDLSGHLTLPEEADHPFPGYSVRVADPRLSIGVVRQARSRQRKQ